MEKNKIYSNIASELNLSVLSVTPCKIDTYYIGILLLGIVYLISNKNYN